MAVPDFQSFMLPLLKLTAEGEEHSLAEAVERLAQEFQLSEDDRAQLLRSGQTRLYNRVAWTTRTVRGSHAHESKAVVSLLDPETEHKRVVGVVKDLTGPDQWLMAYRRAVR